MDPMVQKKHKAMLDRLQNRHLQRAKPTHEVESTSNDRTRESAAEFLSQFSDSRLCIESQISSLVSCEPDATRYKSEILSISESISSLEHSLAESSFFLSPYDIRSSLQCIDELKLSLETLNSKLAPKKKFSFRSKCSNNGTNSNAPKTDIAAPQLESVKEAEHITFSVRESPGFRDRVSEVLVKNFNESGVGEFTLSCLDSCEVKLVGKVSALFVNKLKGCKVYTGPVVGSVLMEEVEDCVFVLASHQIRVHLAERCDFYLRIRSRPIIEDCKEVRFGPYCLKYSGIQTDLSDAGLEVETGSWADVDDFKWLKAVKSPNWSHLEEEERIEAVELELDD